MLIDTIVYTTVQLLKLSTAHIIEGLGNNKDVLKCMYKLLITKIKKIR